MLLIGTKNFGTQSVLTDGLVNVGATYRRYCRRTNAGARTFENMGAGIALNGEGIYHVTATFVGTVTEEGDLAVQLFENGIAIEGAEATETVATPETELHTLVIDYYVLVDASCILGVNSVISKTISFENIGAPATFSNVVVNITKEV